VTPRSVIDFCIWEIIKKGQLWVSKNIPQNKSSENDLAPSSICQSILSGAAPVNDPPPGSVMAVKNPARI
jgi:hypothetical protein